MKHPPAQQNHGRQLEDADGAVFQLPESEPVRILARSTTETIHVLLLYCCAHVDNFGYHDEWIRPLVTCNAAAEATKVSESVCAFRVADDEEKSASDTAQGSNSGDTATAGDDAHKGIDIVSQFLRDDGGYHTAMEEFLHRVQFGDAGEKKSNNESDSSSESSVETKDSDVMSKDDNQTLQMDFAVEAHKT